MRKTARRCSPRPSYVFKDGLLVARAGRVTALPVGGTHFVEPDYDHAIEKTLRKYWAERRIGQLRARGDRARRAVRLLQWRAAAAGELLRGRGMSANPPPARRADAEVAAR